MGALAATAKAKKAATRAEAIALGDTNMAAVDGLASAWEKAGGVVPRALRPTSLAGQRRPRHADSIEPSYGRARPPVRHGAMDERAAIPGFRLNRSQERPWEQLHRDEVMGHARGLLESQDIDMDAMLPDPERLRRRAPPPSAHAVADAGHVRRGQKRRRVSFARGDPAAAARALRAAGGFDSGRGSRRGERDQRAYLESLDQRRRGSDAAAEEAARQSRDLARTRRYSGARPYSAEHDRGGFGLSAVDREQHGWARHSAEPRHARAKMQRAAGRAHGVEPRGQSFATDEYQNNGAEDAPSYGVADPGY